MNGGMSLGMSFPIVDGMEYNLRTGDVITMAAGCKHTLIADTDMNVIEIQVGGEISREDKTVYPMES